MNYLDTDAAQPAPEPSLQLLDKLSKWKDAVELTCQAGNHAYNEYRDAQLESLEKVREHNFAELRKARRVAAESCDRSFAGNSAFPDMHGSGHGDEKRWDKCHSAVGAWYSNEQLALATASREVNRRLPPSPVNCAVPGNGGTS